MRLGLCCKFNKEPIAFRTTTVTYLKKLQSKPNADLIHISNIILDNACNLKKAILFCNANNIGCFRVSSDFFPAITHPDTKYKLDDLPNIIKIETILKECRKLCVKHNIRTSLHPDQFVVLNSPHLHVVKKSIIDLEHQLLLSDLINADVINIHLGGVYNCKKTAEQRFIDNFSLLSVNLQKKLTLENDDKSYSPKEILKVCNLIKIPFVYDVHHHRCNKDDLTIAQATKMALATWNREPLFHISSPKDGWKGQKPNRHHDYIDPNDFPQLWKGITPLTVEVEAKAKELAIFKLQRDLL